MHALILAAALSCSAEAPYPEASLPGPWHIQEFNNRVARVYAVVLRTYIEAAGIGVTNLQANDTWQSLRIFFVFDDKSHLPRIPGHEDRGGYTEYDEEMQIWRITIAFDTEFNKTALVHEMMHVLVSEFGGQGLYHGHPKAIFGPGGAYDLAQGLVESLEL